MAQFFYFFKIRSKSCQAPNHKSHRSCIGHAANITNFLTVTPNKHNSIMESLEMYLDRYTQTMILGTRKPYDTLYSCHYSNEGRR